MARVVFCLCSYMEEVQYPGRDRMRMRQFFVDKGVGAFRAKCVPRTSARPAATGPPARPPHYVLYLLD